MADSTDIKNAVDMLGADDRDANGTPLIAAVRRLCGDDTITEADVVAATAPAKEGDNGTKASTETIPQPVQAAPKIDFNSPKPAAPVVPPVQAAPPAPPTAAAPPPVEDDKPEVIGNPEEDVAKLTAARVAAATEARTTLAAETAKIEVARRALDDQLKARERELDALTKVIDEGTVEISQAEMVKRIQKQTQDRLLAQAANAKTVNAALAATGVKVFASPLDQALANGAKRTVALINGKTYVAPHPRSPEGIRNYGNWVHNGSRQSA